MTTPSYTLEEKDTQGLQVDNAYRLTWTETQPNELEKYLQRNAFEKLDGEQPPEFVYEHDDELMARAWIDEQRDTAVLEVYKEVRDEPSEQHGPYQEDQTSAPLILEGAMAKDPAVSLDEWLNPGLGADIIDESAYERSSQTPRGGVLDRGSPK